MVEEKRDYYEVLGVSKDADEKTLKSAYKKRAMKYHPDRYKGPKEEAEEKFKELNEAYSVLSDPKQRAKYDRFGHAGLDPRMSANVHNANPFDFFSSIFGGLNIEDLFGGSGFSNFGGSGGSGFRGSRRQQRAQPTKGKNVELTLKLSYEEAYSGVSKKIKLPFYQNCDVCNGSGSNPGSNLVTCNVCGGSGIVEQRKQDGIYINISRENCKNCNGTGKVPEIPCRECGGSGKSKNRETISVKIPPGIGEGEKVRVKGKGNPSKNGGSPGDLIFKITLTKHPRFRREGLDVVMDLKIPFYLAALGGKIKVPVLGAPKQKTVADLKIPAGTQSNTRLILKGKGFYRLRGGRKEVGDSYYLISIDVPTKLSSEEKEALIAFRTATRKKKHS